MSKRLLITETLIDDIRYDIDDSSFEDVIKHLNTIEENNKSDYKKFYLEVNNDHSYEGATKISVIGERYENDKEYSNRKTKEIREKAQKQFVKDKQEKDEYRHYLDLKKKYEIK